MLQVVAGRRVRGAVERTYVLRIAADVIDAGDVDVIGRLVQGPFEGHVVGDLSHLLRPDPESAGPRGYRRAVRQPVSPEVLALITGWVSSHWGQPLPGPPASALGQGGAV